MAVDEQGNEIIQTTPPVEKPSRSEERITELSDKVKIEAEGRVKAEADKADAERRATFAEGFVDVLSTNPQAKDHKDEIKEKVLKGYSMEDATYAVLGKAGKLGVQPQDKPQVAGGSATTAPTGGQKEIKDMTLAEKRAALEKEIVWN